VRFKNSFIFFSYKKSFNSSVTWGGIYVNAGDLLATYIFLLSFVAKQLN